MFNFGSTVKRLQIYSTKDIFTIITNYTGCAKKKKDILNIHIKSEGINILSQKFCWTKSTIFVVKCQNFTFIVQLFMT